MKALVAPNQPIENGYYVVQVQEQDFPVAEPLFWLDCADNIIAYEYYYQPDTQQFILVPPPPPMPQEEITILSTTPDGGSNVIA
jgi:hypothetical protein